MAEAKSSDNIGSLIWFQMETRVIFNLDLEIHPCNQAEPILTKNDYGRGRSVREEMCMVARVQSKMGWRHDETIEGVATRGVDRRHRLDRRHTGLATRGSGSRSDDMTTHRKN